MISATKAYEIAQGLGAMKRFPANQHAIAQIAKILCEVCRTDTQANRLLAEMLSTYDEWPGPVSLRNTYHELFPRQREAPKPLEPVTGLCGRCDSWGYYRDGDKRVRCDCEAGGKLDQRILDMLTAQPPPKPPEIIARREKRVITAEDFEALLPMRRKQ